KETISSTLMSGQFWAEALFVLFKIVLVLLIARIIIVVSDKTIQHLIKDREESRLKIDPRRTRTIGKLIRNIITYAINFIAILLILSQLNINLAPLLAGAGIVGLAIGFGAQSLVKDVITGFFIIFEDQFAVGDVIQVNQFKGTVEEIGLRVTKIRSWTGEVHILPNG
ncbi:mechanosensitive ion channel family protein, partial [Streptomyces mayteni]